MQRIKVYTDVLTFPAEKGAGALTITGDAKYDFENSGYGDLDIFLRADLADKITDLLTIKVYVSYDEGASWIWVADYADLANAGAIPISALKQTVLDFAPRVVRDLVFLCEQRQNIAPILANANNEPEFMWVSGQWKEIKNEK